MQVGACLADSEPQVALCPAGNDGTEIKSKGQTADCQWTKVINYKVLCSRHWGATASLVLAQYCHRHDSKDDVRKTDMIQIDYGTCIRTAVCIHA